MAEIVSVPVGWGKRVHITLVTGWRKAWGWFSMQAMFLGGVLQAVWLGLPGDIKTGMDPKWVNIIALALVVLGMVGRVLDQEKK